MFLCRDASCSSDCNPCRERERKLDAECDPNANPKKLGVAGKDNDHCSTLAKVDRSSSPDQAKVGAIHCEDSWQADVLEVGDEICVRVGEKLTLDEPRYRVFLPGTRGTIVGHNHITGGKTVRCHDDADDWPIASRAVWKLQIFKEADSSKASAEQQRREEQARLEREDLQRKREQGDRALAEQRKREEAEAAEKTALAQKAAAEARRSSEDDAMTLQKEFVPQCEATFSLDGMDSVGTARILFKERPRGIEFDRPFFAASCVRVKGFKRKSHGEAVGVKKGWCLVAVGRTDVRNMSFDRAVAVLNDALKELPYVGDKVGY